MKKVKYANNKFHIFNQQVNIQKKNKTNIPVSVENTGKTNNKRF